MPTDWTLSIVVSILKEKEDIKKCSCYVTMKLLVHDMNMVKSALKKDL